MVTTVKLQNPFEYSFWVILAAGILVFFAAALFIGFIIKIICIRSMKRKKQPYPERAIGEATVMGLKGHYIRCVQDINYRYGIKNLSLRDGYQELSAVISEFVHAATGINVENLTAAEIKAMGIDKLDKLMEEYYVPEFAEDEKISGKDLSKSCNTAVGVIRSWN